MSEEEEEERWMSMIPLVWWTEKHSALSGWLWECFVGWRTRTSMMDANGIPFETPDATPGFAQQNREMSSVTNTDLSRYLDSVWSFFLMGMSSVIRM